MAGHPWAMAMLVNSNLRQYIRAYYRWYHESGKQIALLYFGFVDGRSRLLESKYQREQHIDFSIMQTGSTVLVVLLPFWDPQPSSYSNKEFGIVSVPMSPCVLFAFAAHT